MLQERPLWRRKRWLTIGVPLGLLAFLVAIAPPLPEQRRRGDLDLPADGLAFRYRPNDEVYALDMDPRKVRIDLLEGWDREQDAFRDSAALAYVSGPMYERHVNAQGQEITVPLGDIKLGDRVWRGLNRTAARQHTQHRAQGRAAKHRWHHGPDVLAGGHQAFPAGGEHFTVGVVLGQVGDDFAITKHPHRHGHKPDAINQFGNVKAETRKA